MKPCKVNFRIMYCLFLPTKDAQKFKDEFEKCQATLLDKANDSLTEEMNKLTVVGEEEGEEEEEEAAVASGGDKSDGQAGSEVAAVNDDKETGPGSQEPKSQEEASEEKESTETN